LFTLFTFKSLYRHASALPAPNCPSNFWLLDPAAVDPSQPELNLEFSS
jgi:hypothetical protein